MHVFAPGSNIYSTLGKGSYGVLSGTSMATPIVTGVVALVLATHGPASALGMRKRIIGTAHRYEQLSGEVYANGLVDAYNAVTGQMSLNFLWRD